MGSPSWMDNEVFEEGKRLEIFQPWSENVGQLWRFEFSLKGGVGVDLVLVGTQEKSQVNSINSVCREWVEEGVEIQAELLEWRWSQHSHRKTSLDCFQVSPYHLCWGGRKKEVGVGLFWINLSHFTVLALSLRTFSFMSTYDSGLDSL